MRHDEILERLDDFVDGRLAPEEAGAVEAHLAGCEACRREHEGLLALLAKAGELPREIAPARDLWTGIAARIAQPHNALHGIEVRDSAAPRVISLEERRAARAPRRPAWTAWAVRAAAALALVALSSAVTVQVMRQEAAAPPIATIDGMSAQPAQAGTALVAFGPMEAEYIRTADDLAAVLDSRRDQLAPETVRIIEENLRLIDRAIAESRAALEADPNNVDLTLMLGGMYRQKVEMLQSAAQLPLRI